MLITRGVLGLAVAIVTCSVHVPVTTSQEMKAGPKASSTLAKGRQILASNCAACHGIDGKGSERAPNIAQGSNAQQLSDQQLSRIIANGIPGTAMPAFHSLPAEQVRELIAYLRSLEGTDKTAKLPGKPEDGKAIFFGKGGCSQCHMIAGQGGFIASDLTEFARTHSLEQVRSAIIQPGTGKKGWVGLATAILRDGEKYVGRVRNEDNFSIQLQSLDGTFHFIAKSDLEKLEYDAKPLMPNFASTFTEKELNDLVSFLISASGNRNPEHSAKENEMDNLED